MKSCASQQQSSPVQLAAARGGRPEGSAAWAPLRAVWAKDKGRTPALKERPWGYFTTSVAEAKEAGGCSTCL